MRLRLISAMLVVLGASACGTPALMSLSTSAPVVQAESLFGWWGESGKARALDKFSQEEGRRIAFIKDDRGARLEAKLSPTESAILTKVLTLGVVAQKKLANKEIVDGLHRKAVRHLKLMRRQKLTHDSSRSIGFAKIEEGKKILAYVVSSPKGYQAMYTDKGRLLVSFLTSEGAQDPIAPPEDAEADD
ncbi:MAG: hypothetical protein H7338_11825 [Candidatus Sericytochromatia bacterium]|nr:hypothetical protein [Candidatus Sericytochromatia bacterium]